jgi:nicotinate phosphoribosyltransferase
MALLTDLYELTMAGGYFEEGLSSRRAAFEYFFRELPGGAGYAVFAGLEDLIRYLLSLRFGKEDIAYLSSLGMFSEDFLDYLKKFRFTGDLWAVEEGTPVFPYEPLVRLTAPIIEAQIVESALLNFLNFQTLIATKASRVCHAAEGEPVIEFGLRRAHGPDGAVSASRAAFIGGCSATSNVLAGKLFGIPVRGTHAHSWIMSFNEEIDSFRAYVRIYPENPILLVDTYDTLKSGVPNAIKVFSEIREQGWKGRAAVRLDSGDLARLSKEAHRMFVKAGFKDPIIVGSNDLDEELISSLKRQKAKINAWGVGTRLVTSWDDPALGGVYKLASVLEGGEWLVKMKIASNVEKMTDPGLKQVMRCFDGSGLAAGDLLVVEGEELGENERVESVDRQRFYVKRPLDGGKKGKWVRMLNPFVEKGKLIRELPSVHENREISRTALDKFPEELKRLKNPERYWVGLSERLAKEKLDFLTSKNADSSVRP